MYFFLLQAENIQFNDSNSSFFLAFIETLVALGIVCGLAYVVLRWILPKITLTKTQGSIIRIVDATSLEPRKMLYIVEVAGRWMLLASSDAGINLIEELDGEYTQQALIAANEVKQGTSISQNPAIQGFLRMFKKK